MMIQLTSDNFISLFTLTAMETVLGIDNIIFIAILVGKLPLKDQKKMRNLGLILALCIRILLLFSISWLMQLTEPLLTLFQFSFSGRDLILLFGGLFLLGKATFEIHHKVEGDPKIHLHDSQNIGKSKISPPIVLLQILILDIVFSLDSVITAVGMANQVSIMIIAMIFSMLIMMLSAGKISDFVDQHPTIKILALSFLILIGVMLVAESFGAHLSKGYIYFAMGFSFIVELLNMRLRKRHQKENIQEQSIK